MRLLIKKKYFDEIKKGRKKIEIRDAHITFVAEETKETLWKGLNGIMIMPRGATYNHFKDSMSDGEFNRLFDDKFQIWFCLEDGGRHASKNNP